MSITILLRLIKVSAAVISLLIYGHQFDHVINVFGITFISVSYLISLAVFYTILFSIRFLVPKEDGSANLEQGNVDAAKIQAGLLIINIGLYLYEVLSHNTTLTARFLITTIFINIVFVTFPDILYHLLLKLLRGFIAIKGVK